MCIRYPGAVCVSFNVGSIKTAVVSIQQGDGTAFIFKEEPCVFTFSVHCGKNFPLRKQQSDLDVSVEDGLEDKEYLSTGRFKMTPAFYAVCVQTTPRGP